MQAQAAALPAAVSVQAATPIVQGGVTPALPSLSVGGLNYTAVGESAETSGSANSNSLPATQALTAGRDVKFLSVFVVSGGIQMPRAAAPDISTASAATSEQK